VPDRSKGERLIVFHLPTTHDPKDVVRRLQDHGMPNLWVPGADAFAEIPELPMLGSGKLDLKRLADMARERFAEAGRA
jgi:acyl-[acyl-carrier-protein]-phospholipid O-acyltransferase/long-chain-fatty-acid--[acyl-carrier-protein] ligase